MPRRRVELVAGEYYHVYNRGVDRQSIFFERSNYLFFLRGLRTRAAGRAIVIAYCLMPNHFHLLVRPLDGGFADVMQAFGTSYCKAINKSRDRVGPLFQGRFQAIHIDREEYLTHLSRYIHLNPVAAGMIRGPEEWEFSSYRDYIGLRNGTLPEKRPVMVSFTSAESYRRFVESAVGSEKKETRLLREAGFLAR